MKPIHLAGIVLISLALGWAGNAIFSRPAATPTASSERKVLFYQSAMHPWIKSDKPGRCTICGMELTPVYDGEQGAGAEDGNIVPLSQTQIQVLNVQTSETRKQPLAKTLRVSGTIDDDERRHRIISAYVDGRVDKLFANHHGVEVVAGEPLALIYSPTLLQAEREYRQLSGELRTNTALRLRQLGLTAEQIAALAQKPADALTSEILAPLTGTVVEHDVYEGQYVTTGQKMFEIADFSIMWFLFRAYEQDMPWIKLGQFVDVTTPSRPGKIFRGKITFIDPNFDEATRSAPVRVELANPEVNGQRELLHRLYADGVVQLDLPEALAVPRSAVLETGPESVVYVDKGEGAYERRVVKTGQRGDAAIEILEGLQAGDKVVTNGNLLIDGQAEINRSFASPAAAPKVEIALDTAQKDSMRAFLKVADEMAAALAADDLRTFNLVSEPAMSRTAQFVEILGPQPGLEKPMSELYESRHFHGFEDLAAARAAFHKFSTAAAQVLEPLVAVKDAPPFQVWECTMVNQIIEGAPPKGRWVQTGGRPGANPFFGKDMLECAKEIKP